METLTWACIDPIADPEPALAPPDLEITELATVWPVSRESVLSSWGSCTIRTKIQYIYMHNAHRSSLPQGFGKNQPHTEVSLLKTRLATYTA